jgi:hypothetical protein
MATPRAGELQRQVIVAPCLPLASTCRRFRHPPRLNPCHVLVVSATAVGGEKPLPPLRLQLAPWIGKLAGWVARVIAIVNPPWLGCPRSRSRVIAIVNPPWLGGVGARVDQAFTGGPLVLL